MPPSDELLRDWASELDRFPSFDHYSLEEKLLLVSRMQLKYFREGEMLFKEGDESDYMGIVLDREVQVEKTNSVG